MPMSADEFRDLALGLPEVEESSHNDHPDFRLGGKVMATIGFDQTFGMVNLTPEQQADVVNSEPEAFEPFNGAWGKRGYTRITFAHTEVESALLCLRQAWLKTATPTIRKRFPDLAED